MKRVDLIHHSESIISICSYFGSGQISEDKAADLTMQANDKLEAAIIQAVEDMIGPDEKADSDHTWEAVRNKLRAELRQKAKEL